MCTVNVYGRMELLFFHSFLTSALGGGKWNISHLGSFVPGDITPSTH